MGVLAQQGEGVPVLHGLECGLRGRTAHKRGRFAPSCESPPAGGCTRVPATANKFVHILWKNLICDNVAAVAFFRLTPGAGVLTM